MKSVKRILGLILVSMMLMTIILPASAADSALQDVTREAIAPFGEDATFLGDKLNLNFPGVTFTCDTEGVIDCETGVVTRPEQTKNVILTASKDGATKDFAFRIPGAYEEVDTEQILTVDNTVYNCDGTQPTAHYAKKINLKSDGTGVSGKVKVEFYLTRSAWYQTTSIFILDSNDQAPLMMKWLTNDAAQNRIEFTTASSKGGTAKDDYHITYKGDDDYTMGSMRVALEFDTVSGAIRAWVNGKSVSLANGGGYMRTNSTEITQVGIYQHNNQSRVNLCSFASAQVKTYEEMHAVEPMTFYQDDFNSSVAPANIATPDSVIYNTAGGWTPSNNLTVNLNESGTDITGQVNLDLAFTRTASQSITFTVYDSEDKAFAKFIWGASGYNGNALYANYSKTSAFGGDYGEHKAANNSSMKVSISMNTTDKTVSVTANGVAFADGYALQDAKGVAKIVIFENEGKKVSTLDSINCYGYGSYVKVDKYNSFEDVAANWMYTPGGKDTSVKCFTQTSEEPVTGKVTINFMIGRSTGANNTFSLGNAENQALVSFTWWANGGGITIYYKDASGEEKTATASCGFYDGYYRFAVEIDTATDELSVTAYGTKYVDKAKTQNSAANGVKYLYLCENADAGGSLRIREFSCTSTSVVASEMPTTPVKPEVSGLTLDFNAYDKKVSLLSGEAGSVTVIAASYAGEDADRVLVSAVPTTVTLVEDGTVVANTSALTTRGADSVVIYLWNSLDGLQPIGEATVVDGVISAN